MLDRSVTREVFEGLSFEGELLFYLLTAIVTVVFLAGLGIKLRKYLRGRSENRYDSLAGVLCRALTGTWAAATNQTVRERDTYAGVFHASIMWGFIVLFIGTAILTVETDVIRPFAPDLSFYWGAFYLGYSLVLDVLR